MIRGLGIDLVPVARIDDIVRRRGDRFLQRVLTAGELAYCARFPEPGRHWAARFAVKEAALKAMGTGIYGGIPWHDLEVVNLASGQPTLQLTGKAQALAASLGVHSSHVTIAHDGAYAVACVVLNGAPGG